MIRVIFCILMHKAFAYLPSWRLEADGEKSYKHSHDFLKSDCAHLCSCIVII